MMNILSNQWSKKLITTIKVKMEKKLSYFKSKVKQIIQLWEKSMDKFTNLHFYMEK